MVTQSDNTMSETMNATTPVSKDSPLWLAWEAYTATEEYANTKRWAVVPEHAEGSLWAAFERGFAARPVSAQIAGKADEMPVVATEYESPEEVAERIADAREAISTPTRNFWHHRIIVALADALRWLADDRERLLARTTWQPISTAPKDGTRILCALRLGQGWLQSVLYWGPFDCWCNDHVTIHEPNVRHWMPLPAPPTEDTNANR